MCAGCSGGRSRPSRSWAPRASPRPRSTGSPGDERTAGVHAGAVLTAAGCAGRRARAAGALAPRPNARSRGRNCSPATKQGLMHDVDGVNAGYARLVVDECLDNPESVSPEWRALFESGDTDLLLTLPGLARLLEARPNGRGNGQAAVAPAPEAAPVAPDALLLGAVAAAMALVKAFRMHGHLAARLDPLGSAPVGDPALDETRLVPALTPELQARIPARLLRLYVDGNTLLEALPRLREVYCGSSAYE